MDQANPYTLRKRKGCASRLNNAASVRTSHYFSGRSSKSCRRLIGPSEECRDRHDLCRRLADDPARPTSPLARRRQYSDGRRPDCPASLTRASWPQAARRLRDVAIGSANVPVKRAEVSPTPSMHSRAGTLLVHRGAQSALRLLATFLIDRDCRRRAGVWLLWNPLRRVVRNDPT